MIFVLKNCGYAYYIHHLVNQYTRQVHVLLESFRDRISAASAIWVFYFLTCLCFPKVDFIDNLFLSKVQNRRKNICFVSKSVMGCRTGLPQNDHHRAIGMLEAGMTKNYVAVSFGVYHATIWRLAQSFSTTGAAKYRSRSGRPSILTLREERYIRITAGQCSARHRSALHQLFTCQRC